MRPQDWNSAQHMADRHLDQGLEDACRVRNHSPCASSHAFDPPEVSGSCAPSANKQSGGM